VPSPLDSDLSGHPLAASVLDRVPSQAQSLFLPILSMEDGRPLDPPYTTRLFNRLRQQDLPLPPIRFHGLTHSYTALMISSGADIPITLGNELVEPVNAAALNGRSTTFVGRSTTFVVTMR
jgi:hypothetical protein